MIKLAAEKCTNCGLCEKICHEMAISISNGVLTIDKNLCSTCSQCVAICPVQALLWDGQEPTRYATQNLPGPEQLDELFRERRTTRYFKTEHIDRTIIENIVKYGINAPTNNYHLRAIVVDDQGIIKELEAIILSKVRLIYRLVMKPRLIFNLIRKFSPALDPKDKIKIEEALQRNSSLLSLPAAIVFVVGDKRIPLSEASAQYSLSNMIYYAQSIGIGSCLRGAAQIFLNNSKSARKLLGIPSKDRIYGALMLGYPAIRFSNKVNGKIIPIDWR